MTGGPLPAHAEVVIVGAGVAGLVAADLLHRRGVDVLVLEAAGRVGGRTMVETTPLGSAVDLGGQWVGEGHHRFEDLADELGLTRFPMHSPKAPGIFDDGDRIGVASAPTLLANLFVVGLDLASRGPVPDRWRATPLRRWVHRLPSARARSLVEAIVATICCSGTDELSVAAFLHLVRHQGGLVTMMKSAGGAQDSLLIEGAGAIALRLAERLGDRVRLGATVTTIASSDPGVTVTTPAGGVTAAKAIVTVPPPGAARIAFSPALPESRIRLQRTTRMGTVYKALAVYDTPFWRDRSDAELIELDEPACAVFDSSPPDGPGHLTVLVGGAAARRIGDAPAADRRDLMLRRLAAHFGDRVLHPVSWHEKAWHHDPFVDGGYAVLPRMGTGEGFYPVEHTPTGDVHWAGSETAAEHAGYIEGAIESAHRVVAEIA
ncbi:FAD-dependent oxidoreductase [Tsukamurella sp. PLM1]|uniref:flavin monoamine oxidase family protein n=1 Tax=Tsukamurella sp. PLM1 TaxID=2929795 RepID=UPI0020BDC9BE|nr:FAD-dependent oxidoreductase [Tsukamurella sp. PLM1]